MPLRSGSVETLASGLRDPVGVAIDPDGSPLVAESGAGRVVRLTGSAAETVVDGLQRPQGILVRDGQLYIVDAGAKEVVAFDLNSKARHTIASGLPGRCPARRGAQAAARACRRSPGRRARSPASRRDPMARCTFRPTGTAACWRCDRFEVHRMTDTPADHRYLQVARTLRKEIVDGVYPVGLAAADRTRTV